MHSSAKLATPASVGATHEDSNMHISSDVNMMDKRKQLFPVINDRAGIDKEDNKMLNPAGTEADVAELHTTSRSSMMEETSLEEASLVIETIRREEFGLDQALSDTENSLLKKQHARLGRALHCLSQELYSQDSHLLLELVQNADDNTYPEDVEATLAFILQEDGIAVLNNERGFSAENIRALCDIGNSTKKGSNQGYIGNKGIGFKSVFRVTDAPEIHSNGFHVKFDITDGQIGFVLPTAVPPYSTTSFSRMLSVEDDKDAHSLWNTCILLPFRSKFRECTGMCSIVSLFSDLHPSLLLFLHRLKCIKFKNLFDDTLLIMRREILGDGIVRISHGIETMSWLVVSKRLQGTIVRHDVCTTEIAVAFTLQQTEEGDYEPYLKQQPVFAFLPLRNYGLKFILQGDFVLPSSREEVDADSAWNQWLLSEFPSLFVSAQESFCALPCFQRCPGKAVTAFLSFIPLAGEVHGFFSQLPHLILSKLRLTRCMFLDGSTVQWVYPCNTLRGWDEQTKMLFSEGLLHEHLGLGYLSKNIVISDKLSRALGIHDYGPNILLDAISSICRIDGCIESLGLEWLCAWFVNLYLTLLSHSSQNVSSARNLEDILLDKVRKIPCIPLSDGSFTSISDGRIWLPYDVASSIPECSSIPNFPALYGNLRTVSPNLLSACCKNKYLMEEVRINDLADMLQRIGVRKLSGHDIVKNHIMVSLRNGLDANVADIVIREYVSFIMVHLQSSCTSCNFERGEIVSELRKSPIFLTNHGYKSPADEPIHFSKDYGNSVDVTRLLQNVEISWIELDSSYLQHHGSQSSSFAREKWRQFFEEMGVTDFVQCMTGSHQNYLEFYQYFLQKDARKIVYIFWKFLIDSGMIIIVQNLGSSQMLHIVVKTEQLNHHL
ncbi:Histidine kinase- DNA gyrase B- and HSP90-like ATPase family protein [Zea mays]|uniref:Histidine kinase-DNA gyrase B-and HSP90-like ATPase family protein n=1 Tax=Zea mays TaxID=4577 RepID=A0A1D6L879_MAIZE|nr:Histidine kinase- DNA gyrase B- and HSP90-like ATPase family protein [Zea mays]